jgi:hypothetical protein
LPTKFVRTAQMASGHHYGDDRTIGPEEAKMKPCVMLIV